jgi:hypothetical protein
MEVRRDVFELWATLESALSEKNWTRLIQSAQSTEHPIRHSYRLFASAGKDGDRVREALAIYIQLDPLQPLEEPFVMVIAWGFPELVGSREIWNSWGGSDELAAELGFAGPVRLSEARFKPGLMPLASGCSVLLVPLTQITDYDAVQQLLVEPALQMIQSLKADSNA